MRGDFYRIGDEAGISRAALIPSDALQIAPAVTALTDMALRRWQPVACYWRNGHRRKNRDSRRDGNEFHHRTDGWSAPPYRLAQ